MIYQVVDKIQKTIVSTHLTSLDAQHAWQSTWMGRDCAYDYQNKIRWLDRFTYGQEKSMRKHLR